MKSLPDWTRMDRGERVKLVTEMLAEKATASQIAASFANCSRNAAIGFVHRISKAGVKAAFHNRPRCAPVRAAKQPKPAKVTRAAPPVAPAPEPVIEAAPIALPAVIEQFPTRDSYFRPLPETSPIDAEDLEGGVCHWPVNGLYGCEPIYCGQPADGPYCRTHTRIAFVPNSSLKEKRHGAHIGR